MTPANDKLGTHYQPAIKAMQPVIDALLQQYGGFAKPDMGVVSKDDLPQHELETFLNSLDIYYPGATHRKLKLAIRNKILHLGCWKYRVIAKSRINGVNIAVWNPLEIPLDQFKTLHSQNEILYREADTPFPAEDLISDWITQKTPENLLYQESSC